MALGNGGRIYGVPLSLVCLIIIIIDKLMMNEKKK